MFPQNAFDFLEFDSVPANLYLVIDPSQELHIAVRQIACQIPGLVQPRMRILTEGIGNELLSGELWPIMVSEGHSHTTDMQLPRHPHRHRIECAIQDVELGVGNRASDDYRILVLGCDLV